MGRGACFQKSAVHGVGNHAHAFGGYSAPNDGRALRLRDRNDVRRAAVQSRGDAFEGALVMSAVLASPASAQSEVKEKPRMYSYVSFWAIPRAQWGEMAKADAADQKIRAASSVVQDPGKHGRRRGLAVRAGHDERVVARQKEFFERLRKRPVRNFAVQHGFDFSIAARKCIADNNDIRSRIEIRSVESIRPADS
jgi:hypothetical protein